jgi:glycosyltransferase involved in cell wall biosynthesis
MYMPSDRLQWAVLHDRRISDVVVANPYRSRPVRAVRRILGRGEPSLPGDIGHRLQVTPVRLRREDPRSIAGLVRAYTRYDAALRAACERLDATRPAVVCGNPFLAAFAPLEWAGTVLFYAWDDWAAYPPHRQWWPAYEVAYERIRSRGFPVAAVSQVLLDRLAPEAGGLLLPNGIAPEEWTSPGAAPQWFTCLPGPRLLYVGTLDDRVDLDVIRSLAIRFPGGSVVLVGAEVDGAMSAIRSVANVHVAPQVSRREVVGLVHAADVCLLPHRRTALTEAMSPLKLYEYVAGGRPVVASDLPPMRGVSPRIVLVENEHFADAVSSALQSPSLTEEERHAFVTRNSWSSRFEALFAVLWPDARPSGD